MRDASDLARVAAVVGDPARARMLTALLSGMALTATELALEAEVSPSTASAHLAKLTASGIVVAEKQGRHRYFRLTDADVAHALEQLTAVATRGPQQRIGPRDPALPYARVCYDHLAGERGVWLLERLRDGAYLAGRDGCEVTADGARFFASFGVDVDATAKRSRTFARLCLDWSERRHHLGGALGAAVLQRMFALRWARRELDSRAVEFSDEGTRAIEALFAPRPRRVSSNA